MFRAADVQGTDHMEAVPFRFHSRVSLRWADIDANFHVRHTVFYDLGSEMRIRFLAAHGVTMRFMQEQGFGPVLFREECRFLKEVRIEDSVDIELAVCALGRDHRKFGFEHRFMRGEEICALVRVEGAWLNARTRKVFVPPKPVIDAMNGAPRTADFTWL